MTGRSPSRPLPRDWLVALAVLLSGPMPRVASPLLARLSRAKTRAERLMMCARVCALAHFRGFAFDISVPALLVSDQLQPRALD